ncbi:MAG: EAL domain-containing protein [Gammaproteobacteria bacterium]|nr:EAL domain-containing protein [Gammaproteobacteria bacterium]
MSNLKNIIDVDKLLIHAQPIINLKSNDANLQYFEILSRFLNNEGNMLYPDEVFPKLNSDSLIELDILILETTYKKLNQMSSILNKDYMATINISAETIKNKLDFFDYLKQLEEKHAINSENITLEINEKSNEGLTDFVIKTLTNNYSLAIDDFGTKNFPIQKLRYDVLVEVEKESPALLKKVKVKLDQSFIKNLDIDNALDNAIDHAFIDMILTVKNRFKGIEIVAEGVETLNIANLLSNKGIDFGQGYFWKKPALLDESYSQPLFER